MSGPVSGRVYGRVLVTGASGLLGCHLVQQLCDRGYAVRVLVRNANQTKLFRDGVDAVVGDIRCKSDVETAVSDCRYVIHACSTHVYNLPAEEMWEVNVPGTQNVCDAVERHGCERLVFTSTVSALKAQAHATKPAAAMPARQRNSVNKQLADELVVSRAAQGLPAVIVSPSYFVGPMDHSPSPFRLWVPLAILRPVGLTPAGGFNVVGAGDVARAHIWAMEEGEQGGHYPIVGENISIAAYVALINKALGSTKTPRVISPRTLRWLGHGRVFDGYAAALLSRSNFVNACAPYPFAMQPLNEVVKETVEWFKTSSPLTHFGALLRYIRERYV